MDYGDNKFLGPLSRNNQGSSKSHHAVRPDFSRVFSITLKVILALVLISLVVGGIFLVLGGIGKVAETSGGSDYEALSKKIAYETADREHTLIPASEWNKLVVAAAKAHCAVEGMTVQEVERVVGTPAASDKAVYATRERFRRVALNSSETTAQNQHRKSKQKPYFSVQMATF